MLDTANWVWMHINIKRVNAAAVDEFSARCTLCVCVCVLSCMSMPVVFYHFVKSLWSNNIFSTIIHSLYLTTTATPLVHTRASQRIKEIQINEKHSHERRAIAVMLSRASIFNIITFCCLICIFVLNFTCFFYLFFPLLAVVLVGNAACASIVFVYIKFSLRSIGLCFSGKKRNWCYCCYYCCRWFKLVHLFSLMFCLAWVGLVCCRFVFIVFCVCALELFHRMYM